MHVQSLEKMLSVKFNHVGIASLSKADPPPIYFRQILELPSVMCEGRVPRRPPWMPVLIRIKLARWQQMDRFKEQSKLAWEP